MPTITLSLPETTFVSSAQPNSNLSAYPLMYVGNDPSFYECIGLINVALPALPKNVDSAVLQLSVIVKGGALPSTIMISQLGASFDAQTVTYKTMPALLSTATRFSASVKDLYTAVQADITEVVNSWLSGGTANHGIALTSSDGTIVQFGTDHIGYEPYLPKLTVTYSGIPVSPEGQPYGYIYNTDSQSVALEHPVRFTDNGSLYKVTHKADSAEINIEQAGLYQVWYRVISTAANQFTVFQNRAFLVNSTGGANATDNRGMVQVNAAAGDALTLRNHEGSGSGMLDAGAGGTADGVSASMALLKIGPNIVPDPLLTDINAAKTNSEMLSAIRNRALKLHRYNFNQLASDQQQSALAVLLNNRPSLGYLTVADMQLMLDYVVYWTETHVPNPNSLYVKADAADGNGSYALPFGDIQTAIDTVNSGGTVHILPGTYPISKTIQVNKRSIKLDGEGFVQIVRQTEAPSVNISGTGSVVSGLDFTGSTGFGTEFIRICTDDVHVINNHVYAPMQSASDIGVSIIGSRDAVTVSSNTLCYLGCGILVNSDGTSSSIQNNHIFHCALEGISVKAGFTLVENTWDPAGSNSVADIGIHSGSYDVPELRMANNNANMIDCRS